MIPALIQFFEGECLGLGDKQEDEDEADDVPASKPPEGTLRGERANHCRDGKGNYKVTA